MWKASERPRTVCANKALVREFCEMDGAPGDRPLSERRLQVYERILCNKEFRPVTWASCFCKEANGMYRVNGKHTSNLLMGLVNAGADLPEFFVTVERYEADLLSEVAELYATFDSRLGSRSASDLVYSFAATMSDMTDVPRRIISQVVSAAAFAKWGDQIQNHHAAERAELILDHGEFCIWVKDLWKSPSNPREKHKHIDRSSVVSAMLQTWNKAKGAATEFWGLVRDESHAERDHPTRTLARYLSRTVVASPTHRIPGKKMSTGREMYVKSIHAWNAWRRGTKSELKYYADAKLPAVY